MSIQVQELNYSYLDIQCSKWVLSRIMFLSFSGDLLILLKITTAKWHEILKILWKNIWQHFPECFECFYFTKWLPSSRNKIPWLFTDFSLTKFSFSLTKILRFYDLFVCSVKNNSKKAYQLVKDLTTDTGYIYNHTRQVGEVSHRGEWNP